MYKPVSTSLVNGEILDIGSDMTSISEIKVQAAKKLNKFAPDVWLIDELGRVADHKTPPSGHYIAVIQNVCPEITNNYWLEALTMHGHAEDEDGIYKILNDMISTQNENEQEMESTESSIIQHDVLEVCLRDAIALGTDGDIAVTQILKTILNPNLQSVNVNATDFHGSTALILAVTQGTATQVGLLLAAKASTELKDNMGYTALCRAALEGKNECLMNLLEANADITTVTDRNFDNALILAARNGHLEVLKTLIQSAHLKFQSPEEFRKWINHSDLNRDTALCAASGNGHVEIVKELLNTGFAHIEHANDYALTSLCMAAQYGHTDVVHLLLSYGADPNKQDVCEWTSLMLATESSHSKIVHLLLSYGADVKLANRDQHTALCLAAGYQDIGITQQLINAKAPLDHCDRQGNTSLTWAAYLGHTETLRLLLAAGANPARTTKNGDNALLLALEGNHWECAEILLQSELLRGEILDQMNLDGETCFSLATSNVKIMELLLLARHFPNKKIALLFYDDMITIEA